MFLIEKDILEAISSRDLEIITGGDTDNLFGRLDFARNFVTTKIQHRYDPEKIFIDVNNFQLTKQYNANNLVLYSESEYQATKQYIKYDRVSYNGIIYKAVLSSIGKDPETEPTYWDEVQWDGAPIKNESYFYAIETTNNNYPDDSDYWQKGDNRDELIKTYCINIAIYELFKRSQPRNIPDWVIQSREEAVSHLNRIAKGMDTPNLLTYDTDKGQSITYGSESEGRTINY